MSNETASARPMISLVVGLFAFVGIMVALAVGKKTGVIDPTLAKLQSALPQRQVAWSMAIVWIFVFIAGNGILLRL